jgi:hypothetical protein
LSNVKGNVMTNRHERRKAEAIEEKTTDDHHDERYWIALNGPSCAMSSMPMRNPLLTPTPEQMFGFPTHEEAKQAQRICLEAPVKEVRKFLAGLAPDVKIGRIRVIQPKHPQPPTTGESMWTDSPELHQVLQRTHIDTTSN